MRQRHIRRGIVHVQGAERPDGEEVGANEGQLNIVVWAGYAEDGSNDPTVDWVTPFEKQTGCQVNAKIGGTSDEMVQLMSTGQYDGVSASGDATLRLIYGGQVAPVNTSLVPNYATISDFLKKKPWNSVNGQMYGIPHAWGANLLMYNKDVVSPAPDSWSAVFDDSSKYAGKVTAYDSPIYIADAALYLKTKDPSLGIKDPYSLTEKQLDAAVAVLKNQQKNVGEYWSDYTKEVSAFEAGIDRGRYDLAGHRQPHPGRQEGQRRDRDPQGGLDRMVGHLDDRGEGGAPELHVRVDGLDHVGEGERRGLRMVRRGARADQGLHRDQRPELLRHLPRPRRLIRVEDRVLGDTAEELHRRQRNQLHAVLGVGRQVAADQGSDSSSPGARRLGFPPGAPTLWLGVLYLGSILVLLVSAFWTIDDFTGQVVHEFSLDNIIDVVTDPLYLTVTLRTLLVAFGVTLIDVVIARADRVLHVEGGAPRVGRRPPGGRDDAAVGELPGQGVRVAGHPRAARCARLGDRWRDARFRADRHGHHAAPTSGCRT